MNSVDVLDGAINLVKRGWIQGNLAADAEGKAAPPSSEKACSWCLVGSILKAANVPDSPDWTLLNAGREIVDSVTAIQRTIRQVSLLEWNDAEGREQQDVIQMLQKAKEGEEARLRWDS